jgi:hypothetical protein
MLWQRWVQELVVISMTPSVPVEEKETLLHLYYCVVAFR